MLGYSKQAYYKYDGEAVMAKMAREEFALQYAREIRMKDPGMGVIKLWTMYRRHFEGAAPIGRDRFEALMDENGLKVRARIRKPRTTDSSHGLPVYPNLIGEFIPDRANQLWVSDITYIMIWHSNGTYTFCYLSIVLDAYSEEIVGWCLGDTLSAQYPVMALKMALKRLEGLRELDLIHHSDKGCQYASREYVNLLESVGARISMTENGDPKENAKAERINNTMKNELLKGMVFKSMEEAGKAISDAVDFYNNIRPHMSVDMMPPTEAAKMTGPIKKKWRSYREEAIQKKKSA